MLKLGTPEFRYVEKKRHLPFISIKYLFHFIVNCILEVIFRLFQLLFVATKNVWKAIALCELTEYEPKRIRKDMNTEQ